MAEPHVTHVRGQETDDWLHLRWEGSCGVSVNALSAETLEAVRIYLSRPRFPTPTERAAALLDEVFGEDAQRPVGLAEGIVSAIVDALADYHLQLEGTGQEQAVDVPPPPKELATEIVDDWLAANARPRQTGWAAVVDQAGRNDLIDRFAGTIEAERKRDR